MQHNYALAVFFLPLYMQGHAADRAGDIPIAKKMIGRSLYCNVASIVGGVFILTGYLLLASFTVPIIIFAA